MEDLEGEISLMEYAERAIMDLQKILRDKLGGGYGTLKKAMEIEDFLYKEALDGVGEEFNHVWESLEALRDYKNSVEQIKHMFHERNDRDTDWKKLFKIETIRSFRQQLARAVHTTTEKRKAPTAPPVIKNNFNIPAPNTTPGRPLPQATNKKQKTTGKKQRMSKKAKSLEAEIRQREFAQEWGASFNADSAPAIPAAPPAVKPAAREAKREHVLPKITHLMTQDTTSSADAFGMSGYQDEEVVDDPMFLDAQGDDSFFATATLEHASGWDTSGAGSGDPETGCGESARSSAASGWSSAMNERKSQLEHSEAKQKEQSLKQEELRRVHDDVYRDVSSKKEEDAMALAAAAAEEERRVAREREREKRERESQSQTVFMDNDHEAMGDEEMFWG